MAHPLRIAHRGASLVAPENTLAAFEAAIQEGVDLIGIDVHASRDGELVVIHDASLDRTTDRTGAIAEIPLASLREADAGSWFDPKFADQRVPMLTEVLDLARHRVPVLIEVKAEHLSQTLLQQVEAAGASDEVVIQSFHADTIRCVKQINPSVPTALLKGRLPDALSRSARLYVAREVLAVGANALAIWHEALTPGLFEHMRLCAISVWVWTVDDELAMSDKANLGVQGIISNDPQRLNRVLADCAGNRDMSS